MDLTNLKFTWCCWKTCLFWIKKNTRKNQSFSSIVFLHIPHLVCGVRDLRIWNSLGALLEYVYFVFKNTNTRKNQSFSSIVFLHILHLMCGVRVLRIWNSPSAIGKHVYFKLKKNTRKNQSFSSIVSLHIPHLICGVRVLRIWNSLGAIGKHVYFEFKKRTPEKINPLIALYPCIFATLSPVYGTYKFDIHVVVLENMSIFNSKTKIPEKSVLQQHFILAYSPPHLWCTGRTNLKFTSYVGKYAYFILKKNTRKNQSSNSIVSLYIPHLMCGVRDLWIWNSPSLVGKYVFFLIQK